jgi:Cdc6-like AAA superfamily ATPase
MKFYETNADEYISSIEKYNLHNELIDIYQHSFPRTIKQFENIIVYGPVGSGKYSQVLYFLKRYSPSELKYEKKMTVQSEKQSYTFHISDIHYEIDMSFWDVIRKIYGMIFFSKLSILFLSNKKRSVLFCVKISI